MAETEQCEDLYAAINARAKHSPLPWQVGTDDENNVYLIDDKATAAIAVFGNDPQSFATNAEDATLAALSVNNHYQLVAELQGVLVEWGDSIARHDKPRYDRIQALLLSIEEASK